jgi:hypothetical protein
VILSYQILYYCCYTAVVFAEVQVFVVMPSVHPTVLVACLKLSFFVVVIVLLCVNASVQLTVLLLEYSCCCTSEELPFCC